MGASLAEHNVGLVALVVLMGRWLDLYLMILPSQPKATPAFGIIEAGLLLGAAGIALWAVDFALGKLEVVQPVKV